MNSIKDNIAKVRQRIVDAEAKYGRDPATVRLLAVSKTQPVEAIAEAATCGQREFGESYINEALDKLSALADAALTWHFIGPVQSNKTRAIAGHFRWVHSVDREKIARRLSEQRPEEAGPLEVCLQVNIGGESTKAGVEPAGVGALAAAVSQLPHLRLRGLMAIPPPSDDFATQRARFAELRALFERLRTDHPALDTLSMGMSGDLEAAIAEGATMVRVGTAIFGPRRY